MNSIVKSLQPIFIKDVFSRQEAHRLHVTFKRYYESNSLLSKEVYDFIPFQILLVDKTNFVSKRFKQNVLPTYCAGVFAKNGTVIQPHYRPPHCEITFAIQLEQSSRWPWFIQTDEGQTFDYELAPGEGLIFDGCQTRNWRPILRSESSCFILLNYVYCDGRNAKLAFSKPEFSY